MSLTVRHSKELHEHLSTFEVDGGTVASLLFDGGRLNYPGRKALEHELGYIEPYTLEHESRIIEGFTPKMTAAVRILCREAKGLTLNDPTLELLWRAHAAWNEGTSIDRLVCALVIVEMAMDDRACLFNREVEFAAEVLIAGLHSLGFPPNERSLEELFDGAPPAAVGLGLVEL